jgi:hypothetical protein
MRDEKDSKLVLAFPFEICMADDALTRAAI